MQQSWTQLLDELIEFRKQRGAEGLNVLMQSSLRGAKEHIFKNLANASENPVSYCGPG